MALACKQYVHSVRYVHGMCITAVDFDCLCISVCFVTECMKRVMEI